MGRSIRSPAYACTYMAAIDGCVRYSVEFSHLKHVRSRIATHIRIEEIIYMCEFTAFMIKIVATKLRSAVSRVCDTKSYEI